MRTMFLIALAAAAALPAALSAETHTAQSSFSESGEGEDYSLKIVNSTFQSDLVFAPDFASSLNMVFEQRITSTESAGTEGVQSELKVVARVGGKQRWTISDNGNEGEAQGEYYRTTQWGCCGSENTHRHYSAWTGKLAFTATADPLFAAIPNTPVRRAFAYLSSFAADGFDLEVWPNGAGLVTISDGDRIVDRVLLEAPSDGSYQGTPELELSDPTGERQMNGDTFDLWPADGNPDPAGLAGFNLVLSWDPEMGAQATIPVVGGRFDLENAFIPEGLTARRLPLE